MSIVLPPASALRLLHGLAHALVGDAGFEANPDFTLRQLALLLHIYIEQPPHTVRGLAASLQVTKPVISRALDALGKYGLTARKRDEKDRRNVIVQRTVKGALYVESLGDLVVARAAALPRQEEPT